MSRLAQHRIQDLDESMGLPNYSFTGSIPPPAHTLVARCLRKVVRKWIDSLGRYLLYIVSRQVAKMRNQVPNAPTVDYLVCVRTYGTVGRSCQWCN